MKNMTWNISLLLGLMVGGLAHADVLAQAHPVSLRLKGFAVGSAVPGFAADVQSVENFAYVAWSMEWGGDTNHPGGLEIFSVTPPSTPRRVGGTEGRAPANAVHVAGRYAYLAEAATRTFTNDPGAFEIIDVSDPAHPVRVGGIATLGRANAIRVSGNFAYVAEGTRWTGSNLLGALEIFDVSIPTNPIRVGTFDTAGSATSVDVSGGHAYLADGVTDLQVLDVSDPANPIRVGVFNSDVAHNACGFEPGGPANSVQVVGKFAYSSGDNGLQVLDISDPSHPMSIGENFCFPITGLKVSGRYAFVTVWHSLANAFYLVVLDASDPTNLVAIGSQANWSSRPFPVAGKWIYLPTNPLSVYQISGHPGIKPHSLAGESLIQTGDNAPGLVELRTGSLDEPPSCGVSGSARRSHDELPKIVGKEFFRLARP